MSHADGLALLPNGEKFYFEYNGTSDICCTRLYSEYEKLHENWRKNNLSECHCTPTGNQSVILSTSYGRDWHFLFESTICIKCMAITGKYDDNEY